MQNLLAHTTQLLTARIAQAFAAAQAAGALPQAELPGFVVEIPADTSKGDLACNAALVCAKVLRMAPRQLGEVLLAHLSLQGTGLARCELAGPGFMNFFLEDSWFAQALALVLERGEEYGKTDTGKGAKVMVEFVSANPTGPMHIGNARGGALGDCLAAALEWAGYEVTREFYVNDAGNQIERFGLSLEARYLQVCGQDMPVPEDGYQGEDILAHAKAYHELHGESLLALASEERRAKLVEFALPKNLAKMKDDLAAYRIHYDNWFLESGLHSGGAVAQALEQLEQRGLTYRQDGALWYKATAFGGEKDEVLLRSGGLPTYFAADIAYHYNKLAVRGYDKAINIWGADHHGHVARLKGAMEAMGLESGRLDIVLMQLVRLTKDGKPVRMSKRTGKAITLADLIEEVPVDAARFFFNMREPGSTLDFDLDLAAEQSSQNPVYYVQYAHARICSIVKNLGAEGIAPRACTPQELLLLNTPEERELVRLLARFPGEVAEAAKRYDPARLTHFAQAVATLFHKFYNTCRVKNEQEPLMQARLALCLGVRTVLRNLLRLMAIDAPESM